MYLICVTQKFCNLYLAQGKIKDSIVDELSLLLYIEWCATRPKWNRRGIEIPGTLLGAVWWFLSGLLMHADIFLHRTPEVPNQEELFQCVADT
jgi:hypothetical protein